MGIVPVWSDVKRSGPVIETRISRKDWGGGGGCGGVDPWQGWTRELGSLTSSFFRGQKKKVVCFLSYAVLKATCLFFRSITLLSI